MSWLVLIGLWACGGDSTPSGDPIAVSSSTAPALEVSALRAREMPPGAPNSAVFVTLTNPGAVDRAVVGASSSVAEKVELHTHTSVDGRMEMRPVERFVVPAKGQLSLAPGADHIMLIGLKGELSSAKPIDLTLTLDDGSTLALTAPVVAIEGPAGMGAMHGACAEHEGKEGGCSCGKGEHGAHDGAGPYHGDAAGAHDGAGPHAGCATEGKEGCDCAAKAEGCTCPPGACTCGKGGEGHGAH